MTARSGSAPVVPRKQVASVALSPAIPSARTLPSSSRASAWRRRLCHPEPARGYRAFVIPSGARGDRTFVIPSEARDLSGSVRWRFLAFGSE
jgi:hypothetical protein